MSATSPLPELFRREPFRDGLGDFTRKTLIICTSTRRARCEEPKDDAFTRLRGIRARRINGCNQLTITVRALAYLRGIYKLDLSDCYSTGITGPGIS